MTEPVPELPHEALDETDQAAVAVGAIVGRRFEQLAARFPLLPPAYVAAMAATDIFAMLDALDVEGWEGVERYLEAEALL